MTISLEGDVLMCMQTPWEKTLDFHGHVCPGLVIGFRAAEAGMREIGLTSGDENLVAVVENDACGVDAIQVVTGCTLGKGNLLLRDYGKHVYTLMRRDTGEFVRVAVKPAAMSAPAELRALREKAESGVLTTEEQRRMLRLREQEADRLLETPEEELLVIRKGTGEVPGRAKVMPTVVCSRCGEGVMETRARVQAGKIVCPSCFADPNAQS
ncbi:MAG: FmdE family protein [Bacillota bacterium]